jgi:hypothetical protein
MMDNDSHRHRGLSLARAVAHSRELPAVRKDELRAGDRVTVRTCNSVYHIRVVDRGVYEVSGGWFDRKGKSPMRTTIAGCSWGGSIIKADVVAACGLCIEFGNRLVTSAVHSFAVSPYGTQN